MSMTPATIPSPRLLTAAEYARLPDDGRKTELVRGRIVEVPPTYPFHGFVCGKIYKYVERFVEAEKLGRVMTNDAGVLTERDPDSLRGADVCYYSFQRLPLGPIPEEEYFTVAPDLIFEVLSPSDRWPKVMDKISEYLEVGVTVVCVVIPSDRTAVVYRNAPKPEPFAADAELILPDVLPGFRIPLRQFFE
jgi:Uma2 family endonuclease